MGTRNSIGATRESGSKSGIYAKSIVDESPTALRLRLVLKWRTLLPVSEASGTGMEPAFGSRGNDDCLLATGLSDVSSEEKVAGPVMESGRVWVLLPAATARVKSREACIVECVAEVGIARTRRGIEKQEGYQMELKHGMGEWRDWSFVPEAVGINRYQRRRIVGEIKCVV